MKKAKKKWSQKVTKESDALDLEKDVFTKKNDASEIARSLKASAEQSDRCKFDVTGLAH